MAEETQLARAQLKIIDDFITEFLPHSEDARKSGGNELIYIWEVVWKILLQKFGFEVTLINLLDRFKKTGYTVITSKAIYDPVTRIYKPDRKGGFIKSDPVYKAHHAAFIYISVDADKVHALMVTAFRKPIRNVLSNEEAKIRMQKRLVVFQGTHIIPSIK